MTKSKNIVIASVLKPVNEPRMFKKIGRSIAQYFEEKNIHIIGYKHSIKDFQTPQNIILHPIFGFKRLSLARIFKSKKYFNKLKELKPSTIIVTTHELLKASVKFKRKYGCKLIYDVQENYYLNLKHSSSWPSIIKNLLASYVKKSQNKASKHIDGYILAEYSYEKELSFLNKNTIVLPNTICSEDLPVDIPTRTIGTSITLLFSGTISKIYGIYEAIDLTEKLHHINPNIRLQIIGVCHEPSTLEYIRKKSFQLDYIEFIGGNTPVEHNIILEAIKYAHFGLITYQDNPSINNCIPTKMYEYLAFNLPMISRTNKMWKPFLEMSTDTILYRQENININDIYERLTNIKFTKYKPNKNITWEHYFEQNITFFEKLIQ